MPDPSTSRATPAAAASCASVLAPCSCTDSKVTPGFLDIGGDDVDDGVDPGYGGGDRGLVAHVGAEDRDTVKIGRSQDAPRPIRRPNRDAQRRAFGGEPQPRSFVRLALILGTFVVGILCLWFGRRIKR